jgi:hypothetical protein
MTTIDLHKPGQFLKQILFATAWNDLELPELMAIAKEFISPYTEDPKTGKVNIFMALLAYRIRQAGHKLGKGWQAMLNIDDASTAGLDAINFIYKENSLTKQLLPVIRVGLITKTTLYGPADGFDSLTCAEYEDAEVFANKFTEDPKMEYLHTLTAILWRMPGTTYMKVKDGIAQVYQPERWIKLFAKLPPEKLFAIYLWYTGCRNQLPIYFPNVFAGGNSNSKEPPDMMAFTKCIHAGAGDKNGTRQQIRMMNLKEYLFEMDMQAKAAKEMEKEMNKTM